jgi:hypothetical protein
MPALAEILALLQVAQTLYPILAAAVPVIEKALQGQPLTDEDAVTVATARKALEAIAFPADPAAP